MPCLIQQVPGTSWQSIAFNRFQASLMRLALPFFFWTLYFVIYLSLINHIFEIDNWGMPCNAPQKNLAVLLALFALVLSMLTLYFLSFCFLQSIIYELLQVNSNKRPETVHDLEKAVISGRRLKKPWIRQVSYVPIISILLHFV